MYYKQASIRMSDKSDSCNWHKESRYTDIYLDQKSSDNKNKTKIVFRKVEKNKFK